jgi:hypothetical protein
MVLSPDRLLGEAPDQIRETEKAARLQALWEKKRQVVDAKGEHWLDEYSEFARQSVEVERKYPDLPPEKPVEITEIHMTSGACPTQFEGRAADGREVYVRYRGGYLSVSLDGEDLYGQQLDWGEGDDHSLEHYKELMKDEEKAKQMVQSHETLKKFNGGYVSYDGTLSYEQLMEATKGWFIWPPGET